MRKLSEEQKAFAADLKVEPVVDEKIIRQTRRYRLITPLFGGGVKTKEADPIKVIRETSIRGQLRFWWRAVRGAGTQMKEREDAIFGSTKRSSNIVICVKNCEAKEENREVVFEVGTNSNTGNPQVNSSSKIAPYAAFPFLPDKNNRKKIGWKSEKVWLNVEFTLEITYPDNVSMEEVLTGKKFDIKVEPEIQAALWAWETFGGIGGRTRRGFGAIQRTDVAPPKSTQVQSFITDGLAEHLIQAEQNTPLAFPRIKTLNLKDNLGLKTFYNTNGDNCLLAWKHLIGALQNFRQSRVRIPGRSKPSISHWPEPDQIRRINRPPSGAGYTHTPSHLVHKFPRAVFGLPIIFEFPQPNEPPKTELKPADFTRLASPLILRPIACANGEAVALALILDTPPLPKLELKGYKAAIVTNLISADIAQIKPMQNASLTEKDVLKSFLKTI